MTPEVERVMHAVWPRLQDSVTIDTGVMERAQHIAVIPISVGWNDIGSWMQVATLFTHDEFGNAAVGLAPDRLRLPLVSADPKQRAAVRAALEGIGLSVAAG